MNSDGEGDQTAQNRSSENLLTVGDIVQASVRSIMLSDQYRRLSINAANNVPSANANSPVSINLPVTPLQFSNGEISGLLPTFDGTGKNVDLWIGLMQYKVCTKSQTKLYS